MTQAKITTGLFAVFCLGGFLLAIGYGVTFLIPTLIEQRGGDEGLAGFIISGATVSTVILVILSGHIADAIGATRAVAVSGVFIAAAVLSFAIIPSAGLTLVFASLLLGVGWGLFYTLGPILVSALIEPERRSKFFALLSGSMMAGIAAGPIIGRIAVAWSMPVETAFSFASFSCLLGSIVFYGLHRQLMKAHKTIPQISRISMAATRDIARSNAIYSIVMVGIGGAIFGGLSSFQTSYAATYGFDYSLFFVGFMATVILCRLVLAGYVVKRQPLYALALLTGLTLLSIILFLIVPANSIFYLATAAILGIGYGLTYSVINGLAANEAPEKLLPQSLLLFSLAYFVGVFGFPLIAGYLIVSLGIQAMLIVILLLAVVNSGIVFFRIGHRLLQKGLPI